MNSYGQMGMGQLFKPCGAPGVDTCWGQEPAVSNMGSTYHGLGAPLAMGIKTSPLSAGAGKFTPFKMPPPRESTQSVSVGQDTPPGFDSSPLTVPPGAIDPYENYKIGAVLAGLTLLAVAWKRRK